jgi:hypothetical protein
MSLELKKRPVYIFSRPQYRGKYKSRGFFRSKEISNVFLVMAIRYGIKEKIKIGL